MASMLIRGEKLLHLLKVHSLLVFVINAIQAVTVVTIRVDSNRGKQILSNYLHNLWFRSY